MNHLIDTRNLTMSSEQIANLLELRHDNVRQSAINLASHGIITFTESTVKGSGRPKKVLHFDERNSIVISAKLNDIFLSRVVDSWLEMRGKKPALPGPKDLALMVIKAEEEKEAALIEVDRLQGVCNTITAQFAKGVTAPKFCKQLAGVNTQQVNNKLCDMGMLMRRNSGISPTSYSRDRYFAEKQEEYEGKVRSHAILTLAGAKWLYRAYLSNKLPMKNNWDGAFVHMVFEESKVG